jgi:hypothetical protein
MDCQNPNQMAVQPGQNSIGRWNDQDRFDIPLVTDRLHSYSSDDSNNLYTPNSFGSWPVSPFNDLQSPLGSLSSFHHPMLFSDTEDGCSSPNRHRLSIEIEDQSPISQPCPDVEQKIKKRGRPRGSRRSSISSSSKRVPHNQVERKYRDGLNAEMERLRLIIPTVAHWDSNSYTLSEGGGKPKATKAMVLSCAVDYICELELECDRLRRENEGLQKVVKGGSRDPNRDVELMKSSPTWWSSGSLDAADEGLPRDGGAVAAMGEQVQEKGVNCQIITSRDTRATTRGKRRDLPTRGDDSQLERRTAELEKAKREMQAKLDMGENERSEVTAKGGLAKAELALLEDKFNDQISTFQIMLDTLQKGEY